MILKKLLDKIYYGFYEKIFHKYGYKFELEKAIENCHSLLDVGCGNLSPIKSFSKKIYSVGIDAFQPCIEESKKLKIHNKYYKMSALEIDKFKPRSFDCVLASGLVEHLTKEEGIKLMELMEKIAKKKVIIWTPNGFVPQGEHENNPWQIHKSGWTAEEMKKRGYKVIGISGWKPLRGELGAIKLRPRYFWMVVSDISQLFVRNRPEKAFEILCIKTTGHL